MRKLIAMILALTLLASMAACGKKGEESTAATTSAPETGYSTRQFVLYESMMLARQLGTSIQDGYAALIGLQDEIISMANALAIAANPENITAGAFLPIDDKDLSGLIAATNSYVDLDATAMTGALQFSARFCPDEALVSDLALYLCFGASCHIIVEFTKDENGLATATVYPLVTQTAEALLTKYFPTRREVERDELLQTLQHCHGADFSASLSGQSADAAHYAAIAKTMFTGVRVPERALVSQYTSDEMLVGLILQECKQLCGEPVQSQLYHFPAELAEDSSIQLYAQQLYLSWPTRLCATLGDEAMLYSSILNASLDIQAPGAAATEEETPVILALDYKVCTVLVVFYPSNSNLYLSSVTFLHCAFDDAQQLLAKNGATPA